MSPSHLPGQECPPGFKRSRGECVPKDEYKLWEDAEEGTIKTALEKQTSVQSLVLSKNRFDTLTKAREWALEHGFKAGKFDETENTFRFRQFPPSECQSGSFRNIRITDGVMAVICRDEMEKQETPRPQGEGNHAHPHGPDGKHDHEGLPEDTGGHEHGEELAAHRHRRGDPLEGWHVNLGNGFHVHNTAQGIAQDPPRDEVIDAHWPFPKWIPNAEKSQIRPTGGEWRDTKREDFDDHAKVPLHNPSMSIQEHLDIFVGPERIMEIRYVMKDGTNFRPGPKEYEMELEFIERLTQKSIVQHSTTKILHRPNGHSYKLDGEILFALKEEVVGKSEGTVVFLETQRAPGEVMRKAPNGAIDASIVEKLDVGSRSPDEIARDFLGRRIFILEKVRGVFREKDILLALLDFTATKTNVKKSEEMTDTDINKSEKIRARIPPKFRFWEVTNSAQREVVFDALLEGISDGTINLSKDKI